MLTLHYCVIQFCFWFLLGDISNFASVYLLDRGMSNTGYGVLLSCACIGAMLLGMAVSAWADREKSPSVRIIVAAAGVIMAVLGALSRLTYGMRSLTIICFALAIVIVQTLTPFVNSIATESINAGKKVDYSLGRGVGSAGYAVMSYTLGILLDRFGASLQPVTITVVSLLFACSVITFPLKKRAERSVEKQRNARGNPIAFLGRYRRFAVTLAGCVLIYTSHVYLNNFVLQIVTAKGGTKAQMGTAMAIAAVLELPVMFLFTRLLNIAWSGFWVKLSGIFFALKALATFMASSVGAFYAAQIFQMGSWAVIMVASVYYVNSIMSGNDKIKGQAYMSMSYTAGNVIGSVTGGILTDRYGVGSMLKTAVLLAAAGALVVILSVEKKGGSRT